MAARTPLREFLTSEPTLRKVFAVDRALTLSDVVQLILTTLTAPVAPADLATMLNNMATPVLLVSNSITIVGYPTITDNQLPQILPQLAAQVFVLMATDNVDYGLLQSRTQNLLIVLGFGVRLGVVNGLRSYLQPLRVVEVIYPSLQQIAFEIVQVQMSEYQMREYRQRRQLVSAASLGAANAGVIPANVNAGTNVAGLPQATPGEGLVSPGRSGGRGSPEARSQLREDIKALERANMLYPDAMQAQFNNFDARSRRVPPDFLTGQGGWVDETVLNSLEIISVKFAALLRRLTRGRKYFITTGFKHHHGLDFIRSLLQIQGWPYVEISSETKANWQNLVNAYNQATEGILLMTNETKLPFAPFGVDEIIFVEGTKYAIIDFIIKLVFNYANYTPNISHRLVVTFLISRISDRYGSIDSDYYKRFRDIEEDQEQAYNMLLTNAVGLYRDLTVGLRTV